MIPKRYRVQSIANNEHLILDQGDLSGHNPHLPTPAPRYPNQNGYGPSRKSVGVGTVQRKDVQTDEWDWNGN